MLKLTGQILGVSSVLAPPTSCSLEPDWWDSQVTPPPHDPLVSAQNPASNVVFCPLQAAAGPLTEAGRFQPKLVFRSQLAAEV